ncbi:MAG: hypothetical protein ACREJO_05180 [Phycisphaerales bacterium]
MAAKKKKASSKSAKRSATKPLVAGFKVVSKRVAQEPATPDAVAPPVRSVRIKYAVDNGPMGAVALRAKGTKGFKGTGTSKVSIVQLAPKHAVDSTARMGTKSALVADGRVIGLQG